MKPAIFFPRKLLKEIEVELAFFWIDSIFSHQSGFCTSRFKKMDQRNIWDRFWWKRLIFERKSSIFKLQLSDRKSQQTFGSLDETNSTIVIKIIKF